jgi:hypothetical protein
MINIAPSSVGTNETCITVFEKIQKTVEKGKPGSQNANKLWRFSRNPMNGLPKWTLYLNFPKRQLQADFIGHNLSEAVHIFSEKCSVILYFGISQLRKESLVKSRPVA